MVMLFKMLILTPVSVLETFFNGNSIIIAAWELYYD